MKTIVKPLAFALAAGLLLTACAAPEPTPFTPEPDVVHSGVTHCPENRPEVCTRHYAPVCATRDTGVRCVTTPCPSSEQITYSNACTACADEQVISHQPGQCAESQPAGNNR